MGNNDEIYDNGNYMTERITEKSLDFIRRHKDEPFMLYVAYNAPHYPMHAPEKYMKRFSHLPWDRQIMAAMISAVDDGVGEIRNELIRQGIADNTIIYFQSDNGPSRESRNWLDGRPDLYYGGTSGIFKGHKFSLFEGGIRIPAILYWPKRISQRVVETPHIAADLFPTILEACGGNAEEYELDGISLMPLIEESGEALHDYLFWEMEGQTAVRRGKYKLVINGRLEEFAQVQDEYFLSDLEKDPGEKNNLAAELPEICEELKNAALLWREQIEKTWEERFLGNYTSLT